MLWDGWSVILMFLVVKITMVYAMMTRVGFVSKDHHIFGAFSIRRGRGGMIICWFLLKWRKVVAEQQHRLVISHPQKVETICISTSSPLSRLPILLSHSYLFFSLPKWGDLVRVQHQSVEVFQRREIRCAGDRIPRQVHVLQVNILNHFKV